MAEAKGAAGKEAGVPISELTLGEAESFLNSLMCLPEKPEGIFCILHISKAGFKYILCSVQGADEGEKGFVDQTKEFVAGFDEEKEKLLELQGKTDIFYTEPSLFIHL